VLFIGPSHIECGIRPERYSMNVMNLTCPGQNYSCAERLVKKHIERVPNLKVAVIEFEEVPLIANTLASMHKDYRLLLELGLSPHELPTNNILIKLKAACYPILNLPRVTPVQWLKRRTDDASAQRSRNFAAGYYQAEVVMPPDYNPHPRFDKFLKLARNQAMIDQNLRALLAMIDLLRGRGITVVLLRLPHHALYRENTPALLHSQVDRMKRSIAGRYAADKQVVFWDLGNAAGFEDRRFYVDPEHLNVFGANKLAQVLNSKLRVLCNQANNETHRIRQSA